MKFTWTISSSLLALALPRSITAQQTIAQIVLSNGNFSKLETAIGVAGLGDTLNGTGPFTVFAPPDSAFNILGESLILGLLETGWEKHLQDLLLFHAVSGSAMASDLSDGMELAMLNGENLTVSIADSGDVSLTNGKGTYTAVTTPDVTASNGVVHVVSNVLLPAFKYRTLYDLGKADGNFSTLVQLVELAGLTDAVMSESYTLLAPTNDAFAALDSSLVGNLTAPENVDMLRAVLEYHLISDILPSSSLMTGEYQTENGADVNVTVTNTSVMFNDASVLLADVLASNGIVHVIDKVLVPPTGDSTPAPAEAPLASSNSSTIVDLLTSSNSFATLAAAVQAADLTSVLAGTGPFTVFAPPDSAFNVLDGDYLSQLLETEWILHLNNLLTFHAVSGAVLSSGLSDGQQVTTLNNEILTVAISSNGDVTLTSDNGANTAVTVPDVTASNGVIHQVSNVLLPKFIFTNIYELGKADGNFSTLVQLVEMAGMVELVMDETYTLLAPTNDAFSALDQSVVATLTAPENVEMLRDVLGYHLVPSVVPSTSITNGAQVRAANGKQLTASVADGVVKINDAATVVAADILAYNGIVHVLDSVLIPPTGTPSPTTSGGGGGPSPTPGDGSSTPTTSGGGGAPSPTPGDGSSSGPCMNGVGLIAVITMLVSICATIV